LEFDRDFAILRLNEIESNFVPPLEKLASPSEKFVAPTRLG
jgi:hypothetical protein